MATTPVSSRLSTSQGAALYVGALLGPSLLLLPGLAATIAGPASILAWVGLLGVSGLLAAVFGALGIRLPSTAGVAGYARAGLGAWAGRAVGWCFLAGVVAGAPVVCLIGGGYVAALLGGGREAAVLAATVLLALVVALTFGGARATAAAQLALVAALLGLVVFTVLGAAPAARLANWTPFTPHGWPAVGRAAAVLMLSFVGWEAIAPLTTRLRDPRRQLPRVITLAFVLTSAVYLALAAVTVAVLGAGAASPVPLAGLLRVVIGPVGPVIAAIAAVVLTMAATNAYLSGAAALAASLRGSTADRPGRGLQVSVVAVGVLLLGAVASGMVDTAQLVAVPTTLFLAVYLGCTAAAVRLFTGRVRWLAGVACAAVATVLVFAGWALLVPLAVALVSVIRRIPRRGRPQRTPELSLAPHAS